MSILGMCNLIYYTHINIVLGKGPSCAYLVLQLEYNPEVGTSWLFQFQEGIQFQPKLDLIDLS